MALGPEHYAGREQAYVKHFFLKRYFSDLIHKISNSYEEIIYVDGFSGPWQSEQDDLGDTSFGIALDAMRSAKAARRKDGRNVEMHALLVERNKKRFKNSKGFQRSTPRLTSELTMVNLCRWYHGYPATCQKMLLPSSLSIRKDGELISNQWHRYCGDPTPKFCLISCSIS
jgi:hypothetical protein